MNKFGVSPAIERQYGGIQFRSKAEARYAKWLDVRCRAQNSDIVSWRYEPLRFDLRCGTCTVAHYTPDFEVTLVGSKEWHECKGVNTPLGALKIKMFRACYPNEVLRVIDATSMKERPTGRATKDLRMKTRIVVRRGARLPVGP